MGKTEEIHVFGKSPKRMAEGMRENILHKAGQKCGHIRHMEHIDLRKKHEEKNESIKKRYHQSGQNPGKLE